MTGAHDPVWIDKAALLLLHGESLAMFGGSEGLRDEGLLDSALARPMQLLAYGEPPPDLAALIAACASGLAHNHPFVDGNKRAALLSIGLMLDLNGFELTVDQPECFQAMIALADGSMTEEMLAEWLRRNSRAL